MDIYESKKEASKLAKNGDYDNAIKLLKLVNIEMAKSYGYSRSYIKVIPYFQKAKRYSEGIDYAEKTIIPFIKNDCIRSYAHKCSEIQLAFYQHGIYEVYKKLCLCAKREKELNDELIFQKKSSIAYSEYTRFLSLGERT